MFQVGKWFPLYSAFEMQCSISSCSNWKALRGSRDGTRIQCEANTVIKHSFHIHLCSNIPYTDATEKEIAFQYEEHLKGSARCVFLAAKPVGAETNTIHVKVVLLEFYGGGVYRKLSDMAIAPKLHAIQTDHTFRIATMDFEHDAPYETLLWTDWTAERRFKKQREENSVHGDLRRKRVLVGSDGTVKLVDFDWAGEHASFDGLWNFTRKLTGIEILVEDSSTFNMMNAW